MKTEFWGRRGIFSAAVFSSDYKDMQVSQVGVTQTNLTNASAAKINGLELEDPRCACAGADAERRPG